MAINQDIINASWEGQPKSSIEAGLKALLQRMLEVLEGPLAANSVGSDQLTQALRDAINSIGSKVPNTRTVNGKALSENITIGPGDIMVGDQTLADKLDDMDEGKISGIKTSDNTPLTPDSNGVVTLPPAGSTISPATNAPSMDGTAAVGSSAKYAREDHVHPHDTSKANASEVYTKTQADTLLAGKQNTLTFDNAPTAGSNNPVKSGGIKTALDNLLQNLHIGQNGNWYVGQTDTNIQAQGPAGNVNITDASDLVTILVNDLTTGGGGNILSAEMGKILKVAITTLIDSMGEYCFPNGRPTLSFETPKWDVVQNLTNVDTDFHALRIDKDGELTIHLTAKSGYTIGSVVVMMGNVDVTTTYYTESTGTIHIPQVTDNVEITAIGDNIIYSLGYAKPENLVFMLDGLSQGDNANAWTDLINGVVFTPHGATKAAKGWSFDGNDDYMDGDSNMGDFDPYTHTIEVCINSGLTNTNYFVFVDSGGYMVVNYLYNYQNHDYYVFRGTAYTDSHSTKNGALSLGSNVRDNGNGVKILSYNGNVQDQQGGRINGEIKSAESLCNSSASGYPTVGARYKVSSSEYVDFFKGTIYAIRIYNTKLTLAEILANQKKDNERFELGLTLPNS